MWRPDRTKLVKIRLHTRGERAESAWAEDCGPAPAPPGARFVRLASIPFVHAKPTYGDVVVAAPERGHEVLGWDSEGRSYAGVVEALIEDAGRWTMVLGYDLEGPAVDADAAVAALERACEGADIAVESCFGPFEGEPGRAYLAVPGDLEVEEVLAFLAGQGLPLRLTLVHPRERESDG
jgi:hypothetical protein